MLEAIVRSSGRTHAIRAWVNRKRPDKNSRGYLTECGRRVRYGAALDMKPVTCEQCLKALRAHRGAEVAARAESEPRFNAEAGRRPRRPSLLRRPPQQRQNRLDQSPMTAAGVSA